MGGSLIQSIAGGVVLAATLLAYMIAAQIAAEELRIRRLRNE